MFIRLSWQKIILMTFILYFYVYFLFILFLLKTFFGHVLSVQNVEIKN